MGLFLSSSCFGLLPVLCSERGKAVLRLVACDQVRGARGRGQGTETVAKLGGLREGVSPSHFTRLVRLSYLAPDITQAILEGRQPRDLTADQLLAHSRLPLAWQEQRTLLGFG
jgi:hypothetical protein